jgi:low affinity Fe/Cu permease
MACHRDFDRLDDDTLHPAGGSEDALAVHAKLDELLKASSEARTELAAIDEREPEVIEKVRDRERKDLQRK